MLAHPDIYENIPALLAALEEDKDFRIRCFDRKSDVTIISPHGGYIEAGTSHIATAIAGDEYNLFDFQGLQKRRPWELHVTSSRFRHPLLRKLLSRSVTAVSIHGMGTVDSWNIWLGGLNLSLKQRLEKSLTLAGFAVKTDLPKYKGTNPRNVVNLVPDKGVQLELPQDLIEAMFDSKSVFTPTGTRIVTNELFERFATAVRNTVSAASKKDDCSSRRQKPRRRRA